MPITFTVHATYKLIFSPVATRAKVIVVGVLSDSLSGF